MQRSSNPAEQNLDNSAYRRALGQFATGVTVITTSASNGAPVGLTVNSFNSVSLEPPLILWSLSLKAASFASLRDCERYLVHVLAADQTLLAQRFATRGATKFSDSSSWQLNARGLPQLKGCVAIFECRQQQQVFAGDHLILIGQVEGFYADGGMPLIFHNSQFVTDMAETALPRGLQGQLG